MKNTSTIVCALFACGTVFAASKTMTTDGEWSTAANWSPPGVPASGDVATIDGRTVSIPGGSGYSLNGLAVSGANAAVSLSGKVYFANANNANAFSWTQNGGSFYADVGEFELGKSGAGNSDMTFVNADVTFLHRVILGRASTAEKCVYAQRGGRLTIDTRTGTSNGFFIGTGSGGATVSLSNVTAQVYGTLTVCNGTARSVLDIENSDVTFNGALALGNPDNSKSEFRIRKSNLTIGMNWSTGSTSKRFQRSYAQISNCTVDVGSKAISVASGICSTSRIDVVGGSWTRPGTLTIGANTGSTGEFKFEGLSQPLDKSWDSYESSEGAEGTLELVNSPSTFTNIVKVGKVSNARQTLLLAGCGYDMKKGCNVGGVGNARLVLKDASLAVAQNVQLGTANSLPYNVGDSSLLLTNSTLDIQGQLLVGQAIMGFTSNMAVDEDSKVYVTNSTSSAGAGTVQIGRFGTANLDLSGSLEAVSLYIGNLSNAVGTVTVNAGANLKVINELVLGFTGCGDATLGSPVGTIHQKGGAVTISGNEFLLGGHNASFNDALGVYRISGGVLTSKGALTLGRYGEGRFYLEGGEVKVPQVTTRGNRGTMWLDGGILNVTTNTYSSEFVKAGVAMKVCDCGAVVHSDFDVAIPATLSHGGGEGAAAKDGGLVKKGEGTLTISATPTFTGDVKVEAGTLDMSGTSFALGADAVIGGGGTLVPPPGGLTVTGAFTLDPTNAPTLTVAGPVTIGAGATITVADPSLLDKKTSYRLYTATATSGTPELVGFPRGWIALNNGTTLRVSYSSGTTILFR